MNPLYYNPYKTYASFFNSNGDGFFNQCLKCDVTEELNDDYFLEMTTTKNDRLARTIAVNGFIKAKPNPIDSQQMFYVTRINFLSNGLIDITAQHIKSLLLSNYMSSADTYNLNGSTPATVLHDLQSDLQGYQFTPISFVSDITTTSNEILENYNARTLGDLIAGENNSILSIYGGELKYSNAVISLLQNRGKTFNKKLVVGYNVADYTHAISNENNIWRVIGYAKITRANNDGCFTIRDYATIKSMPNNNNGYVEMVDFTEDIKEKYGSDVKFGILPGSENVPQNLTMNDLTNTLRDVLNKYVRDHHLNGYSAATATIDIDYQPEYEAYQKLGLGDTVTIMFPGGETQSQKVCKVVYDCLNERYKQIEIGTIQSNIIKFMEMKKR